MAQVQASRGELWKKYYDISQDQLQELDRQIEALGQAPWEQGPLRSVQRVFHNFSGSGALYSAPQVSALGGEGEYMCSSILLAGRAIGEGELQQIESLVRRIRAEFQNLMNAAAKASARPAKPARGIPLLFLLAPETPETKALAEYLSKRRVQVEILPTLAVAERRLDAGLPDLVAVSLKLDGGSAYDFVRSLRIIEGEPSIPVLLLGESQRFLDKVEAIHCGADGFVAAPPDPATVLKKFKAVMAKHKGVASKILVVEDDPAQARFVEECLVTGGYQVSVCQDPSLFEADLYAFHPALVLMDVLLPGASGYDLVRFMRQEEGFAAIPVIFITTEGQRRSQILAAEAGGDDFLAKPVTAEDLLSIVRSRLARHRSLQDLMDHDDLTGLLAHTPFLREARLCLTRYSRRKIAYAAVLFRVDRLDEYGARYGAKAGDTLVVGLAKFLQRKIRQTDVMGRYGDQELAVVLEHLSETDALRLIQRLQQEFQSIEHPLGGDRNLRATFSAGIAMTGPDMKTLKDWLDRAGAALQDAIRQGGNRTIFFGRAGGEATSPSP